MKIYFHFGVYCIINILWLLPAKVFSQNVGINTLTPQSTLDVKGNYRFGGNSSFISFDSATGRIVWNNTNLYVPVSQALMKHSAAGDGLFYNNTSPASGQLEYRNAGGEPVFFTNFTNGNGYFKSNLGIGTQLPLTPLHVKSNFPNIATFDGGNQMWLTLAENGVPRGYIGSYAGNPEDVELGTYAATTGAVHLTTNNTPRLTVINNGNVGVGQTNPTEKMEITGNVKADAFKYTNPKIHYYAIPCVEFTSVNSGYLVFNQSAAGGAYISNAPGSAGLNAPLHLPDGATIISIRFDFYDASPTQDLQGRLMEQALDGYGLYQIAQSSGSGGNSIQTIDYSIGGIVINNQASAYFIYITASSGAWNTPDLRIKRVVVGYSLNEAQ
jgi:hypothetical protein